MLGRRRCGDTRQLSSHPVDYGEEAPEFVEPRHREALAAPPVRAPDAIESLASIYPNCDREVLAWGDMGAIAEPLALEYVGPPASRPGTTR